MTRLSADHAFRIGAMHLRSGTPCQDYATSGVLDGGAYAIVSDGCSGGRETDVGARLYALSMASCYRHGLEPVVTPMRALSSMENDVKCMEIATHYRAHDVGRRLALDMPDMLCTLVHACVVPDVGAVVRVRGDGAYALVTRDGSVMALRVEWNDSRPAYPAHAEDDYAKFFAAHGGGDVEACTTTWHVGKAVVSTTSIRADVACRGLCATFDAEFLANVATVAVFSDGVAQCGEDWYDVVCDLLRLHGTGRNVARRMHGFVRRRDGDRQPQDDIAMAAICIEREEER